MKPLAQEFGRLLALAREEADMSQADLAARLRLKRTSVSNIECGRQRATLEFLYGAATALGKAPAELLPSPESVGYKGRSASPVQVATDDSLTDIDRSRVLEFASRVTARRQ